MRILVSFKPKEKYDRFEGARLRKTIKGALELSNTPYTDDIKDVYDIAHFISYQDEALIDRVLAQKIPVVFSALYCENDMKCSLTTYTKVGKETKLAIKKEALRVLNKVNVVLTPNEKCRTFLIDNGIKTRIEIVPAAVNITRFGFLPEVEKSIFYHYYQENPDKELAVALGRFDNLNGVNAFIKAAKLNPDVLFYYFAQDALKLSTLIKTMTKSVPSNLKFKKIPTDDVYRSALVNAKTYVYCGYDIIGAVSLLEAMASKNEIIVRKQELYDDLLIDGSTCHVGEFSETISTLIDDAVKGKLYPTTEKAFELAVTYGVDSLSKQLNEIYSNLLTKTEE